MMIVVIIFSLIIHQNHATLEPSTFPTATPSFDPTQSTLTPSVDPTLNPTPSPTPSPTSNPTSNPTDDPSPSPTFNPTADPTPSPTPSPSDPTFHPSTDPTSSPTDVPSNSPTEPTLHPTTDPTLEPTEPTTEPTTDPTVQPTPPTLNPTRFPTPSPTHTEFCVIQSEDNHYRWFIFGITICIALFLMFFFLKYCVNIRMAGFCSIFTWISLCVTISLAIASVAYGFIVRQSFPECGYHRTEVYPIPIAETMNVFQLYMTSMVIAWFIFIVVLVAKIYLLRLGQEFEDKFKIEYEEKQTNKKHVLSASTVEITTITNKAEPESEKEDDFDELEDRAKKNNCCSKCCHWLASKIKYQFAKFVAQGNIILLLTKCIVFLFSFSLCATLTSLYQVGTSYNEYGDTIYAECGCIDENIGQISEIQGQGLIGCFVGPLLIFGGYCIMKLMAESEYDCDCEGGGIFCILCKCYWGLVAVLIAICLVIYGICVILFAICSPFLLIGYRSIGIAEKMHDIDFDIDFDIVMYLSFLWDSITVFFM